LQPPQFSVSVNARGAEHWRGARPPGIHEVIRSDVLKVADVRVIKRYLIHDRDPLFTTE
jgi:hypothetical protein